MHTCAKFGLDRSGCLSSFPHLRMCDPLTPLQIPLGLERFFFLADVHSQLNLHTWFATGPSVTAKVVSVV